MDEQDWQQRAAKKRRNRGLAIATLVASGMAAGFLLGFFEDNELGLVAKSSIPPMVAIIVALTFLIAVVAGNWKMLKLSDELERRDNLLSTAAAGFVAMIAFPCWFVLWKGGLVPEPNAMLLFLFSIGASAISHVYLKLTSMR